MDFKCKRCASEWNNSDMVGTRICPNCGNRQLEGIMRNPTDTNVAGADQNLLGAVSFFEKQKSEYHEEFMSRKRVSLAEQITHDHLMEKYEWAIKYLKANCT